MFLGKTFSQSITIIENMVPIWYRISHLFKSTFICRENTKYTIFAPRGCMMHLCLRGRCTLNLYLRLGIIIVFNVKLEPKQKIGAWCVPLEFEVGIVMSTVQIPNLNCFSFNFNSSGLLDSHSFKYWVVSSTVFWLSSMV